MKLCAGTFIGSDNQNYGYITRDIKNNTSDKLLWITKFYCKEYTASKRKLYKKRSTDQEKELFKMTNNIIYNFLDKSLKSP